MLRRPHYIAFGLIVVLTVLMLNLPSKTAERLKLGIGSAFVPLIGVGNSARQAAGAVGDALLPKSELIRELEALRKQNEELRLQATQAESVLQENGRLRQLVGWQRQKPWKLRLARVVLREPANWWRSVQIDLGSRDGIRTNMPVLTPEGLVGRVSEVGLTRSQVVLLGDPTCKVAARVDNPTHDSGVIGPASSLESQFVEMSYLSAGAVLKPGQTVKTSGDGGIFPANIPVGTVVEAHSADYGLTTVAKVKLNASLSSLEEVWVMLQP